MSEQRKVNVWAVYIFVVKIHTIVDYASVGIFVYLRDGDLYPKPKARNTLPLEDKRIISIDDYNILHADSGEMRSTSCLQRVMTRLSTRSM